MSMFWSFYVFISVTISTSQQSSGHSDEIYGKHNFFCSRLELTCEKDERIKVQTAVIFSGKFFTSGPVCFCDKCPIKASKYSRRLKFTPEEMTIVKKRCEDKIDCSLDPRFISWKKRSPFFAMNITYSCQPDEQTIQVTIGSLSETETATNFKFIGVNTSIATTTVVTEEPFSVDDYLTGVGSGVVLVGLPVAVLCIVLARRRRSKKKVLLSTISKEHPTYDGLTDIRLSNIYDVVEA